MEIKNNKGDILALIYNFSDISEEKTFLTENSQSIFLSGLSHNAESTSNINILSPITLDQK